MQNKIRYFIGYIAVSSLIIFPARPYIDSSLQKMLILKKKYETKSDLNRIKDLLMDYRSKNREFPPEHRFIVWFKNNSKNRFRFNFPLDRWGEVISYRLNNDKKGFILKSAGEDKKLGSDDDIEVKI